MVRVVCRAIDDRLEHARHTIVAIVNRDGPQIHKQKHDQIEYFVQRED